MVYVVPKGDKLAKNLTAFKIDTANKINSVMNSKALNRYFFVLALYNLKSEIENTNKAWQSNSDKLIPIIKAGNSLLYLTAASMKLIEISMGAEHAWVKNGIQRPLFTLDKIPFISKRLATVGGNTLVKTLNMLNFTAGSLGVGISTYDFINSWNHADYDAAMGHAVAVAGGLVVLSSPLLAGALLIPGFGWLLFGVALIFVGGLGAAFATDGPLEKNIKLGPLGIAPNAESIPDDDLTYYPRLLTLLTSFELETCQASKADPNDHYLQSFLTESKARPQDIVLTVHSSLISQFKSWKDDGLTIAVQELQYSTTGIGELGNRNVTFLDQSTPLTKINKKQLLSDQSAVRFVIPRQLTAKSNSGYINHDLNSIRLRVCIQAKVESELGEHILPYPLDEKNTTHYQNKHREAPKKETTFYNAKYNEQVPFWFTKEIDI